MANFLSHDCPYCETAKSAFLVQFSYQAREGYRFHRAIGRCQNCSEAAIFALKSKHDSETSPHADFNGTIADVFHFEMITYAGHEKDAPENIPPRLETLFTEGTQNLRRGNYESAGMALRKVLDLGTKLLCDRAKDDHPELESARKKMLFPRTEALHAAGELTPALYQWVTEARYLGNDATHEDEALTEEDANDLKNLVRAFLLYCFTFPSLVERRGRDDTDE